jgi:hypothetical protein
MGRRKIEDEESSMVPRFAIGDVVQFDGSGRWKVKKYHRVGTWWEVVFEPIGGGKSRSIPCARLELY